MISYDNDMVLNTLFVLPFPIHKQKKLYFEISYGEHYSKIK